MEEKQLTIEERLLRQVNKKKRKRRNKKILKFVLMVGLISMIVFYLVGDISKVKSLTVKNNHYYSDRQILEIAGIDYDSRYVLTLGLWVNYKLERDPLIKDAHLKKDLHGGFTIEVEEERIIGYLKTDTNLVLIQGKGIVKIKDVSLSHMPRIGEFSNEQLNKLNKSFETVDASLLTMISEIVPHSETYNNDMIMLIMNDGNRVITGYNGISLINQYKRILPQLEGTHVCLFMDELSNSIIKQNDDCVKKNSEK